MNVIFGIVSQQYVMEIYKILVVLVYCGVIMELKNLIQVATEASQAQPLMLSGLRQTTVETIAFDPATISQLSLTCNHDNRYKALPFGIIKQVRELEINIKPRKQHKSTKQDFHQNGVNKNILVQIEVLDRNNNVNTTRLTVATLNVKPLMNKEQMFLDAIIKYQIDVLVLTETWLPDSDDDKVYVDGFDLYLLPSAPRLDGLGGGITLVCR